MRLNSKIASYVIILLTFSACQIGPRVDVLDSNNDRKVDFWLHWNKDGTLNKTIKLYNGNKLEIQYEKAEYITVDGKRLRKQKAIPSDFDNSIKQTTYTYTRPFKLVYGENYMRGKFHGRSYFRNNIIYKAELDANYDGKIDSWQYFENGQPIRHERDTNFDGTVDEIKKKGKDF